MFIKGSDQSVGSIMGGKQSVVYNSLQHKVLDPTKVNALNQVAAHKARAGSIPLKPVSPIKAIAPGEVAPGSLILEPGTAANQPQAGQAQNAGDGFFDNPIVLALAVFVGLLVVVLLTGDF